MGRPFKGQEKYNLAKLAPILERCGKMGCSLAELADEIDCDTKQVRRWREAHPEFAELYMRYRTRAEAYWARIHAEVAKGDRKGDAKLIMHRMTSQFREEGEWAPPTRVELTGKDGGPMETKQLSEEVIDAKLAALLTQHPELKDLNS